MTPFLEGFADELVKLSAPGEGDAAAGTGIKPPKPLKPIAPMKPLGPIEAPKFGAPPGLPQPKLPRMPRSTAQMPKKKGLPKPWTRPRINQ